MDVFFTEKDLANEDDDMNDDVFGIGIVGISRDPKSGRRVLSNS